MDKNLFIVKTMDILMKFGPRKRLGNGHAGPIFIKRFLVVLAGWDLCYTYHRSVNFHELKIIPRIKFSH